jgi:hypothetical protein
MLNWLEIASNGTWIFALAVGLAVLSFAYWRGAKTGQTLRRVLAQPLPVIFIASAGGLFFLGLAASLPSLWAKILSLLMAGLSFIQAGMGVRSYKVGRTVHLSDKEDGQDNV